VAVRKNHLIKMPAQHSIKYKTKHQSPFPVTSHVFNTHATSILIQHKTPTSIDGKMMRFSPYPAVYKPSLSQDKNPGGRASSKKNPDAITLGRK